MRGNFCLNVQFVGTNQEHLQKSTLEYLPVSVARFFSGKLTNTQKRLISNAQITTNVREHRGGKLEENVKDVVLIFV